MRGVAVLTITGVLSQLVGFVYRIGLPRLAVTYAKQQKIRSAALFYLQQENRHQQMLSFDVIEILVEGNVARLHHLPHCF